MSEMNKENTIDLEPLQDTDLEQVDGGYTIQRLPATGNTPTVTQTPADGDVPLGTQLPVNRQRPNRYPPTGTLV